MRLVITHNGTLHKDGVVLTNLDFSQCNLPDRFWALQWNERGDNTGHIEYNSRLIDNTEITELPEWAYACIAVWQAKIDQKAAEAAAESEPEQTP